MPAGYADGLMAASPGWALPVVLLIGVVLSVIESGRAVPCEYGIYPLEYEEMKEICRVDQ